MVAFGRVPLEAVQRPPEIEVGSNPQEAFAQMDKNSDLRNGVQLEICYLKPVEMKKTSKECPDGQTEALLVERPEDHRLSSGL
jgi:uncharacterized membrane protein